MSKLPFRIISAIMETPEARRLVSQGLRHLADALEAERAICPDCPPDDGTAKVPVFTPGMFHVVYHHPKCPRVVNLDGLA